MIGLMENILEIFSNYVLTLPLGNPLWLIQGRPIQTHGG